MICDWILALFLGTAVPAVPHTPYTCTTDYECQLECEGRGDVHCDDPYSFPQE